MLSKKAFAENKIVRYTAYTIVIGFALMMFLPTTISLPELFRGAANSFISVNGSEIFNKNIPYIKDKPQLQASVHNVLAELTEKGGKPNPTDGYWLNFMLNNWNLSAAIPNSSMERYRAHIKNVIQWQMNYNLAQDMGYDISKDKLGNFIKKSYELYLKGLYKEYLDEFAQRKNTTVDKISYEDFRIDNADYYWEEYYKWAIVYLKEYYLVTMITNPLQNGTLVLSADVDKEIEIKEHKVKVDFALYTYDAFVKSASFRAAIKDKDIKDYYKEHKLRSTVEEASFDTKESAQKALDGKSIFSSPPLNTTSKPEKKDKATKKKTTRKVVKGNSELYKKVGKYNVGDISSVIKDEDAKYHVYKIITKTKSFALAKENTKEYQRLLEQYGKNSYDKFKAVYAKYSLKIMKELLLEAKDKDMRFLKGRKYQNIKTGRTNFFSQDDKEITLFAKKDKDAKKAIEEFIIPKRGISSTVVYNRAFFKEAYSLSKGNVSKDVIAYDMKDRGTIRKLFFVLKKVDEQKPKLDNDQNTKRELLRKIKLSDQYIFMNTWTDYLQKSKDYDVSINNGNILGLFGFDSSALGNTTK